MENESLSSPQLVIREQNGVAVALSHRQILSLFKKSENSGHSFDTLKEVYQRGYAENLSEQDAFNRVNSFVAGGAAADMDIDLFEKRGLWDNIHAKRERIKRGSGEHMRKPGSKGAPSNSDFKTASEGYISIGQGGKSPYDRWGDKRPDTITLGNDSKREKRDKEEAGPKRSKRINDRLTVKETVEEARKSAWNKMASATKKHAGKDLDASDQRAKEAIAGLKQSHRDYQAVVDRDRVKKEEYTGAEKMSSNPEDPTNRFAGTTALTNNYKKATPGQSSTLSIVKRVVKEAAEDSKGHKSSTGGLTQKGRDYYNNKTGGHLQAPVTKKPSELKKGSKSANRRKSFCARMGGMKKKLTGSETAHDPDSRINKALRKWNC